MSDISIGCKSKAGRIKPLHGVNNGPVCYGSLVDVTKYYQDLAVPYVRLHDTSWPNPREVDIHTIFPDFGMDADNPENYDFRRTDEYIKSVLDTGAQIIYRLGVSIEHTKIKYHTHPPKDYEKWARICIGIIRHYNEGWANGFHYNIRYWEIWNEPDNPDGDCMWSGTPEQYFDLYKVASAAIKNHDPDLKVGGYAATMINPGFMTGFLEFCRTNKLIIDFFSWHTYANSPHAIIANAKSVERLLEEYGFGSAEIHLNEWNYSCNDPEIKAIFRSGNEYGTEMYFERAKGMEGACFDAAVLILLQDCKVDIANFYDASPGSYWSLFNAYGIPQKNYYALKAFRVLHDHPVRISTELSSGMEGLYCCSGAAENDEEIVILVCNNSGESREYSIGINNLPFTDIYTCRTYLLDENHDLVLAMTEEKNAGSIIVNRFINKQSLVLYKITRCTSAV